MFSQTWNSVSCCISSSCSLLLLSGGRMLRNTFRRSRLSPDTLDRVKIGVMLHTDTHKKKSENKTINFKFPRKIFLRENANSNVWVWENITDSCCFIYLCEYWTAPSWYPPCRLSELLRRSHSIIRVHHHHGNLVAARLLEDSLQLADSPLHCAVGAQINFTDYNKNWHLQSHGQSQVLPSCTSWKKNRINILNEMTTCKKYNASIL